MIMCCYLTLSEEDEVLEVRQGKTVCDADPETIGRHKSLQKEVLMD